MNDGYGTTVVLPLTAQCCALLDRTITQSREWHTFDKTNVEMHSLIDSCGLDDIYIYIYYYTVMSKVIQTAGKRAAWLPDILKRHK